MAQIVKKKIISDTFLVKGKKVLRKNVYEPQLKDDDQVNNLKKQYENCTLCDLKRKAHDMKHIMTYLHDNFAARNQRYEELLAKYQEDPQNVDVIKELRDLDDELNKKEEELRMAMILCRYIMFLQKRAQRKLQKERKNMESQSVCSSLIVDTLASGDKAEIFKSPSNVSDDYGEENRVKTSAANRVGRKKVKKNE